MNRLGYNNNNNDPGESGFIQNHTLSLFQTCDEARHEVGDQVDLSPGQTLANISGWKKDEFKTSGYTYIKQR